MAISSNKERWIIQAKHRDEATVLSKSWRIPLSLPTNSSVSMKDYYTLEEAISLISERWNHSQWHFRLLNLDTQEAIPYEVFNSYSG